MQLEEQEVYVRAVSAVYGTELIKKKTKKQASK